MAQRVAKVAGEGASGETSAPRVYRARRDTSVPASRLTQLFRARSLPPEMRTAAAHRLGLIALSGAVVFVAFFVVFATAGNLVEGDAQLAALYGTSAINALPPILANSAMLFSIVVFYLSRRNRVRPEPLLKLGIAYQIYVALAISVLGHLPTWQGVEHFTGWSGVAVWIIVFAVVIPNTPRRALAISLMIALMDPLGLGVTIAFGAPVPPGSMLVKLFAPTVIAVALAVFCSVIIHRLGREIERARRLGSYELVELLGKGGMGEVWRGEHNSLARPAAIKLVRLESFADNDAESLKMVTGRFEREAQTTATLESEHTVQLYDFGVASDGSFYYAMELLRGLDLEQLVTRFGPVPPERLVHLLLQACHSLEEAHHRGLVHRDIKPANLYVCRKGLDVDVVKVLDFGLVKRTFAGALGEEGAETRLTAEGCITGTPDYIAPEMVTGEGDVDARTDLYSLGCVAWFALTGQSVFTGGTGIQILLRHVNEDPGKLADKVAQPLPEELAKLVEQCLAKASADRPRSVAELRRRLEAVPLDNPWSADRAHAWWDEHQPDEENARQSAEVSADAPTMLDTPTE